MLTREKWAQIIKDFHEKDIVNVIPREIIIPLKKPVRRAVSIIGPRRTGKTYEMFLLMKQLIEKEKKNKENILYVNFERADLGFVTYQDLVVMLEVYNEIYPENKEIWFFFDEIQNVEEWEKFVRTCLDEGINIYLSGSSSKLLSKEIATSMRGRNLVYIMYPLSFVEFLKFKNFEIKKHYSTLEKSRLMNLVREYLNYGGYPEVGLYKEERDKILRDIFDTAIYKDVVEREKIRNVKVLKLLINALLKSKEFSVNKFYNFLKSQGIKVGKNVLYNYLEYLNDVFFVFLLRKFEVSYKKEEQSIPKVYFIDNGLLNINNIDDKGRYLENLVFVELLRREKQVSYYQTPVKEEVDFVVRKGKKVEELIQVCYDVDNFTTKDRELRSLVKAAEKFKCNNLLVITMEYEAEEKFKGKKIKFVPLWRWLIR